MTIFITGATGYIGGSVAARLIQAGHHVTGLARTPEKAAKLAARGITPVLGDLDDGAVLTHAAQAADIVINAASSDHRPAIETLIEALAGSGKTLLHTSGSSIVGTAANGEPSDDIYTEATPLEPAPEKAARVALDARVREAAGLGIRSVVLCNTMIYGHGLGLHRDSVQIPPLVAQARASGVARHIGRGLNIWSNVHIDDMADLYLLALENAPAGSFYFVENGEAAYRDITAAIARNLGLGPAQDWPVDAAIAAWGYEMAVFGLGSNSRVRADKARAELGWRPRHTSVIDWVLAEAGTVGMA